MNASGDETRFSGSIGRQVQDASGDSEVKYDSMDGPVEELPVEEWKARAREMCSALGYEFQNLELLYRALNRTERSRKGDDGLPDYEHMEFVGDALVGLVVKFTLSREAPGASPHELTKASTRFLRNTDPDAKHGSPMYRIAKTLGLEGLLNTGGTPLDTHGYQGKSKSYYQKTREFLLVDHVEAIFGAMVIDCGYNVEKLWHIMEHFLFPTGLNSSGDDFSSYGQSTAGVSDIGDSVSVASSRPQTFEHESAAPLAPGQTQADSDVKHEVVQAAEKGHVHILQPGGPIPVSTLDIFTLRDALEASVRGQKANVFALVLRAVAPKLSLEDLKSLQVHLQKRMTKDMRQIFDKVLRLKQSKQ